MLRMMLLVLFAGAVASQIPFLLGMTHPYVPPQNSPPIAGAGLATSTSAPKPQPVNLGSAILPSDGRGHFTATFRLNGKSVQGLVDTGATAVAINETTARRLGFSANSLDFRYVSSTANGDTRFARVVLDRVEIGGIRVDGVEAAVLRDTSLSSTLIGMSFLKRLSSFKVEDGELRLKQ